jgi:hypothetical protein
MRMRTGNTARRLALSHGAGVSVRAGIIAIGISKRVP